MKIKVNTEEENDAMYSTDEEGEYADESKQFHAASNAGGPYNINLKKTYKPVFIVFLDGLIFLNFFFVSIMYFWIQIPNSEKVTEEDEEFKWHDFVKFFNFMPVPVTILWIVFLMKFFVNLMFLRKYFGLKKANSSNATFNLYWLRVFYDVVMIGGALVLFASLKNDLVATHEKVPT